MSKIAVTVGDIIATGQSIELVTIGVKSPEPEPPRTDENGMKADNEYLMSVTRRTDTTHEMGL